jgi:hypothetical protein
VPAGELPGLAVGFKRESYRKVIAEFAAHLIVR